MSEKRLKALEEEIAYLTKELKKYLEQKPVEIHYHYYYDYNSIKDILDKYIDNNL